MAEENIDEKFMRMALHEAEEAMRRDEIPIGAVVVCKGQVIARAYNLTETLTDVTAHAEMQAITSAANRLGGKYLTDCTLYVRSNRVSCAPERWGGRRSLVWCMARQMKNAVSGN